MPSLTISPRQLRPERRTFQKHHTFPTYTQHPSEHVAESEVMPEDWLELDYPSPSPDPPDTSAAPLAQVFEYPHPFPTSSTRNDDHDHEHEEGLPLEGMSPLQRHRLFSENNQLLGMELDLTNEVMTDERLLPTVGMEEWTHVGDIELSQSDTHDPVPLHALTTTATSALPAAPPTAVTDSSPESVFPTPLAEQQRRARAAQQTRLMKDGTPTPATRGESPKTKLLISLAKAPSFVALAEEEEEEEEEVEDPRRKLFSPRLDIQDEGKAEEEEVSERLRDDSAVATLAHSPPAPVDARAREVEEEENTPSKASQHSGYSTDGASPYSPGKERLRQQRATKRHQNRAHPYSTRTRTRYPPPSIPFTFNDDEYEHEDDEQGEETSLLTGDERKHQKVRDFARYLDGPKRLREPRFDLRIFHWAMEGCAELKWEKSGNGVYIPDIDRFYKNVLHKEAREKRESKGLKVSKKDLPQKNSFERQLSGYGFTRSSSGRTLHFARADLRKSDSALLKKVTKAWKELKSSVRQAKPAKEPRVTPAMQRKQASAQQLELEHMIEENLKLRNLLTGLAQYQKLDAGNPVLVRVKREFPELDMPSSDQQGEEIKTPVKSDHASGTKVDADATSTPLKSLADPDVPLASIKTRRTKRVKRERH